MHDSAAAYNNPYGGNHVANGSNAHAADSFTFDAAELLREQKEFLERAQAGEIRASLFLRLRLSAQQKLTVQRNQFAERTAARSRRWPISNAGAVPASARTASAATATATTEASKFSGGEEVVVEEEPEEGQRCLGCARRYFDASSFTRHQSCCKEYAALLRKRNSDVGLNAAQTARGVIPRHLTVSTAAETATVTASSAFKDELQAIHQRLESSRCGSPHAEATTARGLATNTNGLTSSQSDAQRRGDARGRNATLSLRTESRSTSHSFSLPYVSTPQEERRDESNGRKEREASSLSRELTPPSPGCQWQQRTPPCGVNQIDEMPAAVAARLPSDMAATVMTPFQAAAVNGKDDGEGVMGKSGQALSCRQSSVAFTSNSGSVVNMGMESDEPLKPCPHCGRQFFAMSRWPRHVAVCEQQQHRIPKGGGHRQVYDPRGRCSSQTNTCDNSSFGGTSRDASQPLASSRGKSGGDSEKKNTKWRRQRAQLRQALQLGSGRRRDGSSGGQEEVFEDDRVCCPTCGRRFAPAAAERHIPFCRERQGGLKSMRM
ncbi:hypothetical protein DQ04_04561000 [Trypanosoma grayi]|uniref:hypothetical protein n=1 Tax=Trypanosoma grayi TaxID=71804 RepID=UPI0004F40B1F|nr:hypothetical protein DQ04_04561000 [Trypanosoma grayi]KEG09832.1 hypothetical protein DQ04_04561000 [Trypanosoma grayi]